ncbi:SigB/SigF/SigG family RNA polymerase sigma factor [Rhodococcus sp. CX]|uniref:SigB/SigF/SigG family RNA polymerase sigma factor n=1 Tax=Rhodococcus sp. CX TaxID=2789880 RepID=UPI0018CF4446|nr:SigB/SigF/SigG family RNA polymerase sigma factor [Rhodococcus sp. CX]MBH0120419.1 SigB/SigF/SigG family RNA polymerase sigma factor [Rhodococcus sp. CX]
MTLADIDSPPAGAGPANNRRIDEAELAELFVALRACTPGSAEATALHENIVTASMPLAQNIAQRFAGRGEDIDDLNQVAYVGLLQAIDRFDAEKGRGFAAYAVPTVMGEIRRYFRDHAWSTRVPRRLKDLTVSINKVTDDLSQRLGRSPTAAEIAAEVGAGTGEVIEALAARSAYQPASLDTPLDLSDDGSGATLADTLGEEDEQLAKSERYLLLKPLLERVPERERHILILRFFEEKSQSEIAREIGVSQVHVSRLLARTLAEMRSRLAEE